MPPILDVLNELRSRPGVILGRKSAHTLHAFLTGFTFPAPGRDAREALAFLSGFNRWVRERYKVKSSQGWAKIIAFYSTDETEELNLFWKLLDDYLENSGLHERPVRSGRKVAGTSR